MTEVISVKFKDSGRSYYFSPDGKTIKVELVDFIRPEKKFASFQELKENVIENAQQALEIVKL